MAQRAGRALASAPPWSVLGASWLVLVLYAFPGQLTQDSFDHLIEARAGVYSDSHPPVVSALWRCVDRVIAGAFGMLVVQSVSFLGGIYLVCRRMLPTARHAAWVAAGVFVFPPVMIPFAVIWKDCLMAGFLMLGLGLLLSPRRALHHAALVALCAATAVRYNALAATLPLVVVLWQGRPEHDRIARYALAFAAWLAITFAAFGLNRALTDHPMFFWHSSLAVHDIVGTLAHIDDELPDAELVELFAGTELRIAERIHATATSLYDPENFLPIVLGERALWTLPITGVTPAPAAQRDAIARAWQELVTTHPGAYLAHRAGVMRRVLWFSGTRPFAIPWRGVKYPELAHGLGVATGWSHLQLRMTYWMKRLDRALPIFTPWLWLVVCCALLPLTRRHRDVFALLASGVAIEGSLLLLAGTPDYRYSHWMVICAVLAVIVLTARRARQPA